jgi:hypothetical protein
MALLSTRCCRNAIRCEQFLLRVSHHRIRVVKKVGRRRKDTERKRLFLVMTPCSCHFSSQQLSSTNLSVIPTYPFVLVSCLAIYKRTVGSLWQPSNAVAPIRSVHRMGCAQSMYVSRLITFLLAPQPESCRYLIEDGRLNTEGGHACRPDSRTP